jgi:hypothetical protein
MISGMPRGVRRCAIAFEIIPIDNDKIVPHETPGMSANGLNPLAPSFQFHRSYCSKFVAGMTYFRLHKFPNPAPTEPLPNMIDRLGPGLGNCHHCDKRAIGSIDRA